MKSQGILKRPTLWLSTNLEMIHFFVDTGGLLAVGWVNKSIAGRGSPWLEEGRRKRGSGDDKIRGLHREGG
jgi:hypothetical protein